MVRTCSFLAFAACLIAGLAPASEFAQLGGTAELEARIAALEERLAEHDAEARIKADGVSYLPAADESATSACAPCGPCVGRDFAWGRCRTEGYYGGAEIMWLKPFSSGGGFVSRFGTGNSLFATASANEFLPGWRLWGGHQNCDGLGWRVNWWQWDQFSSGVVTGNQGGAFPVAADVRLVFQKLDLLATQMVSFRKWDLMFLGGVTYAGNEYSVNESYPPLFIFSSQTRFDGWGLTVGTLVYRDIGWFEGLQGYGGVQWSGVYGNSPGSFRDTTFITTAGTFQGESTMANILELKVGTQYERRIGWGAIGFVSAGFESQYWAVPAAFDKPGNLDNLGNLGLVGFTVGTGIRR
jgi:hypothetical protein